MSQSEVLSQQKIYWEEIKGNGYNPPPMSGHSMVLYKRKILVFGGYDKGIARNRMHVYDLDSCLWTFIHMHGSIPSSRTSHSCVVDEEHDFLYVLCGSGSRFGYSNLGDIFEYNIRTHTWRELTLSGDIITPRYGQSALLFNRKLYVFGGTFGLEFTDQLFEIDLDSLKSTLIEAEGAPCGRYKHSVGLLSKDYMVIIGGSTNNIPGLNDVYLFNLYSKKWVQYPCHGNISPRFSHSMVLHNHLYVFGGTDLENVFSDLLMLDLFTRTWKTLSLYSKMTNDSCEPKPRYFHNAVFDPHDSKMYVFGGKGSNFREIRYNDLLTFYLDPPTKCSLAIDFKSFFENQYLCDLKILCLDGVTLCAHSTIIFLRCSKILDDFNKNPQNQSDSILCYSKIQKTIHSAYHFSQTTCNEQSFQFSISVPYSSTTFKHLLYYLYSDILYVDIYTNPTQLFLLMFCAHHYELLRLERLCQERLEFYLRPKTAIYLFRLISLETSKISSFSSSLLQFLHDYINSVLRIQGIDSSDTDSREFQYTLKKFSEECKINISENDLVQNCQINKHFDISELYDQETRKCMDTYRNILYDDPEDFDNEILSEIVGEDELHRLLNITNDISQDISKMSEDNFFQKLRIPTGSLNEDLSYLLFHPLKEIPFDFSFNFYDQSEKHVETVLAHTTVLAARSQYFRSFSFLKGMLEASKKSCDLYYGPNQISPIAFRFLLNYLYGGKYFLSKPVSEISSLICSKIHHSDTLDYDTDSSSLLPSKTTKRQRIDDYHIQTLLAITELLSLDVSNYFGTTNQHLQIWMEKTLIHEVSISSTILKKRCQVNDKRLKKIASAYVSLRGLSSRNEMVAPS